MRSMIVKKQRQRSRDRTGGHSKDYKSGLTLATLQIEGKDDCR